MKSLLEDYGEKEVIYYINRLVKYGKVYKDPVSIMRQWMEHDGVKKVTKAKIPKPSPYICKKCGQGLMVCECKPEEMEKEDNKMKEFLKEKKDIRESIGVKEYIENDKTNDAEVFSLLPDELKKMIQGLAEKMTVGGVHTKRIVARHPPEAADDIS